MEKLIPWVRKELPKAYAKSKEMHKSAPLSIVSQAKSSESVGFKAGIWSSEQCDASMHASGIYEASGLALWLQTGAFGSSSHDDLNWQSLEGFKEKFFSKRVAFKASVTRMQGTKKQKSERKRILWPVPMICAVDSITSACHENFDASLPLIGTGHFVLWAWYLATYEAIMQSDKEHLELLWEAALSVTLQLRLCPTVKDKSLARNFQSEAVKALGHASLSDSFLTFAGLARVLAIDKVQDGVAMGLAYNGAVYNAAIHKAALSMAAVLEDSDRHVEQSLSRLELQYGRDILSSEYSKLSKLIAYARSVSPSWSMVQGPRSNGEIMAWMVDMLLLAFKTKLRLPSKATEGWLDKDRKTGMPGYWQVCAVILQVFEYAEKLLSKLPEPELQKAKAVLEDLLSPLRCWEKFLQPDEKALADTGFLHEDDLEEEGACAVVVPSGPLAAIKEIFNKATGQLFDLVLELVSGKHYSDCQELASQAGGLIKALQDTEQDLEFLKQLRLVTELVGGSQSKSVTASTAAPTPSLLMQLTSTGQVNAEADAERERHWKIVQSERRKFVSFGLPKSWTKESLLSSFRACGKVFSFAGQLNTSHRLLCASADLMTEQGDEPWVAPSVPPAPLWKEVLAFMTSSATGAADFVMAFDGRMREEDDVLSQAHACEATIVYTGGCPPRAGRSRRVPLSGRKVETVAIRCPVQRTRIKATKKETFTACGEESTYQGTYTGVAFRASLEIPLISLGEKSKVMDPNSVLSLPRAPEDWVERNGEDCPLFWGESKPIALWCAILDEWKVQAVLDCSPGSGALME
ncbi:unnamed protein product, partial [Cladocopium goreaui]